MLCPICNSQNPATASTCAACGTSLGASDAAITSLSLPLGASLQDGAYLIQHVLGQGGFGITYLGHDTRLRRPVAIKEFFPAGCLRHNASVQLTSATSPGQYATIKNRFLEEARTLAQFHHTGIVDVYTCFEENNTAYMVMEFLQGKTLLRRLEEHNGPLGEAEAVGYIRSIATALQVVHGAGLLHRDLKPDNIMVCPDGRVVLIDFGTAKEYVAGKTQNHSIIVTPGYAPLEQYAQRAQRGTYTDIYALAATLYHLLTGELPIAASDRAMGVELPPIQQFNPDISEAVAAAVRAGLTIEIAERPQSVPEFLTRLDGNSPVAKVVDTTPNELNPWLPVFERAYGPPPSPPVSPPAKATLSQATVPKNATPPGLDFLTYMQANAALTPTSLSVPSTTSSVPPVPPQTTGSSGQSPAPKQRSVPLPSTSSQAQARDEWSYFINLGLGLFTLVGLLGLLSGVFAPAPPPTPYYGMPYQQTDSALTSNNRYQNSSPYDHDNMPVTEVKLGDWDLDASVNAKFSPDGKTLIAGYRDGTIKFWDSRTGALQRSLACHQHSILNVALSPNGKWLASIDKDDSLQLLDASTGTVLWHTAKDGGLSNNLTFSPDSQFLAYGLVEEEPVSDSNSTGGRQKELAQGSVNSHAPWGKVAVRTAETGKVQATFNLVRLANDSTSSLATNNIAFSPDGRFIAAGGADGALREWQVTTQHLKWAWRQDYDGLYRIAFAPDGRHIVSMGSNNCKLWDTQTGTSNILLNFSMPDVGLAFAPQGEILACGHNRDLVLIPQGNTAGLHHPLIENFGYGAVLEELSFTPDGHDLIGLDILRGSLVTWHLPDLLSRASILDPHSGLQHDVAGEAPSDRFSRPLGKGRQASD